MKWSDKQNDIIDDVEKGKGNTSVNAVAGSGKTTTITHAMTRIGKGKKVLFVAFNKHIATALQEKIGRMDVDCNVSAMTLNSFGWRACMNAVRPRRIRLETRKTYFIYKDLMGPADTKEDRVIFKRYLSSTQRLVALAKAHAFEADEPNESWLALIDRFDIDIEYEYMDKAVSIAKMVFSRSANDTSMMDFDDQIYMPLRHEWSLPKFDFVFVDEAQDLNKAQMKMIMRAVKRTGRIIIVGDPHQAIYGFRGADADAMDNLIEALDAKTLPLSITYRCPKAVVAEAQSIVPHIEAAETADDGEVLHYDADEFIEGVEDKDYVLCRTTAPLVHYCLRLIGMGKKANVLGRDIGEGLKRFINNISGGNDNMSLTEFIRLMNEFEAIELPKLQERNQNGKAQKLTDDCEAVMALSSGCQNVKCLLDRVERIFSDDCDGITLSTIHKAKGLESQRIFVLAPHLLPHPMAKSPWQRVQEDNLKYVAITRALNTLIWVNTPRELGRSIVKEVEVNDSDC